jgi:hypothetical protein
MIPFEFFLRSCSLPPCLLVAATIGHLTPAHLNESSSDLHHPIHTPLFCTLQKCEYRSASWWLTIPFLDLLLLSHPLSPTRNTGPTSCAHKPLMDPRAQSPSSVTAVTPRVTGRVRKRSVSASSLIQSPINRQALLDTVQVTPGGPADGTTTVVAKPKPPGYCFVCRSRVTNNPFRYLPTNPTMREVKLLFWHGASQALLWSTISVH